MWKEYRSSGIFPQISSCLTNYNLNGLNFRLVLLNKLLEDGNTLFRHGRLNEAAYRYEYALKRLPRLKETCNNGFNGQTFSNQPETFQESNEDDIFVVLKSHLLLNLSR